MPWMKKKYLLFFSKMFQYLKKKKSIFFFQKCSNLHEGFGIGWIERRITFQIFFLSYGHFCTTIFDEFCTITWKIRIGEFLNYFSHSVQHIPLHRWKLDRNWGEGKGWISWPKKTNNRTKKIWKVRFISLRIWRDFFFLHFGRLKTLQKSE